MSASSSRPASVAGYYTDGTRHRSTSNASVGPQHQHHDFRQISRLISSSHSLVSQVTGLKPDDDEGVFRAMVDMVTRSLDYNAKAAPSSSMSDISKLVNGRAERARINSQDPWADALQLSFALLKSQIEKIHDIDSEITPARLPGHLSFLMHLSVPPTQLTVEHAESYLVNSTTPHVASETFDWKNILDEEPFEGQHWEGVYGLPPGSTVEGWETRSLDSSTFGHRQLIEDLQRRQYWRAEWQTDASLTASVHSPSADRILGDQYQLRPDGPYRIKYIHEHDAVREMLMAFQGYKNSFLIWARSDDGNFSFEACLVLGLPPTLDAPRIIHTTRAAQLSVVQSFAQTATTIEHLRKFATCAFSEAVETQIDKFNSWCAAREPGSMPPLYTMRDSFSHTFDALLEVLRKSQDKNLEVWMLLDLPMRFSPFTVSAFLLDTLLTAANSSSSNGETETSKTLMHPIWSMVGLWLKHGMPTRDPASRQGADSLTTLDDEFFIQATGLPILDPDFWTEDTEAYSLVGNHVLRAGKAVGLLRILDLPLSDDAEAKPTFTALLQEYNTGTLVKTSRDHLSRYVHDSILPYCQAPQKRLAQMVASECDLWLHLAAIEELYFKTIFAKMDSMQTWSDFHFLNNTFRDIMQKYAGNRMEPTLIRFSYSGSRDQALRRAVEALDGLLVEYAAPFPLTYLFGLHSSSVYRSVFVFLLQIRRAKGVLERAHTWNTAARRKSIVSDDDKIAFAMRSKLLWFINTLLGFIMTHVLHRRLSRFHASLKLAGSLDETISLHESHLKALESECLLHSDMSTLRQAILSILDIAMRFHDALTTHAGQAEQASPRIGPKLHRGRRVQQERSAATESDLEYEDDGLRLGPRSYRMPSASRDIRDLSGNIAEMQDELDGLVRFVRREVEGLAGGTSAAASTFSVLAFTLEDWDR
ncbi:Spc98 family-domain-containing protein [Lactarius hatsudake]|nr:Spc98 family-domain-containing protein [Lactarius hatsudake]